MDLDRLELTEEEMSDILYVLKDRKESLTDRVLFYNSLIKDNCVKRVDMLTNILTGVNAEILRIDLIMLKLKKYL